MTAILRASIAGLGVVAAGCGDDPFRPAMRYRMVGLPAAEAGACPAGAAEAAPAIAGATRARLTYVDASDRSLRCDVVLDLAAPPTVVSVPDATRPVDLIVEYVDDAGAVVGRGEAKMIALDGPGEATVRVAPASAFACTPDRPAAPRAFHSATPLPGGDVLLIGGVAGPGGAAAIDPAVGAFLQPAVELYDGATGETRPVTIAGHVPRAFHEAYVIAEDEDGVTIALVGGITVSGAPDATPVAVLGAASRLVPSEPAIGAPGELIRYDRATATFSREAIGGGFDVTARGLAAMPPTGAPAIAAVGGVDVSTAGDPALVSADRVDPATGLRTDGVALLRPRIGATVTPLDATRLLVWGGDPEANDPLGAPRLGELLAGWDGTPVAQALDVTAGGDAVPHRRGAAAALAGDGAVIVAGGYEIAGGAAAAPAPRTIQRLAVVDTTATVTTVAGEDVAAPVGYPAAVRLPDGDVLVAGGNPDPAAAGCAADHAGLVCAAAAAWRYDTATATAAPTGALGVPRYGLRLTLLADGTVVASGGLTVRAGAVEATADLELYEPRGAADDPLLPAIVRAPGDVARTATGDPLAPCDVVTVYADGG